MITKKDEWERHVKNNSDPYRKARVDVAREVMAEIDRKDQTETLDCHKLICDADEVVKAGGITGFMAGAVASMVSQCHSRGNEFRQAWNQDHGVDEAKAQGGVVNPAIVTIDISKELPDAEK